MSKIQEYLNKILSARYGKDVRQAIHDAIFQCYEDGKAGEVDLVAREGVVELGRDVAEIKEDMAALDSKVETFGIATTKENTIKNTKHGGFRFNKIVANTVQNGTPSPSTPFPLLSTGDCVEFINGMVMDSGAEVYGSTRIITKNKIPCKKGDVVKIQTDLTSRYLIYYDSNGNYISYKGVSNNTDITIDVECSYFKVEVGSGNTSTTPITPQTVGKITITINGKYLGVVKTIPKNLINNALETTTKNGVTCTKNGDGTYTLNGTCTDSSDFIVGTISIPNGTYKILGCPSGGGYNSYLIYIKGANAERTYDEGNGKIVQYDNVGYGKELSIFVIKNTTLNNLVFKPMITTDLNATYDDFVQGGVPTEAYFLTQYPMIKGSTLYRENGLVKAMHTMTEIVFDGVNTKLTHTDGYYENGVNYAYSFISHKLNYNEVYSNIGVAKGDVTTGGVYVSPRNESISVNVYDSLSGILSTDTKEQRISKVNEWCKANNVHVIYEIDTPIIETLDTASQIALNSLETFDGVTYVEFDTRVQPLEFEAEVGTSQVGAYTLQAMNVAESNAVKIEDAINTMLLITP